MKIPMVHPELVHAATALLLAEHSQLVEPTVDENGDGHATEAQLAAARESASAYLVACFDFAATAIDENEQA